MVNFVKERQHLFLSLKKLKVMMLVLLFLGITPAIAVEENRTSRLRVQFDLDGRGRPTNLEIIESSGNRQFDKATLEAIEEMRFDGSDANKKGISADINVEFKGLNAYVYPPQVVDAFIDSCSKDKEESKEFCVCTIDAVQKRYPLETFLAVSLDMSNGNISAEVEEFFKYMLSSCMTEFPLEQTFPFPSVPEDNPR